MNYLEFSARLCWPLQYLSVFGCVRLLTWINYDCHALWLTLFRCVQIKRMRIPLGWSELLGLIGLSSTNVGNEAGSMHNSSHFNSIEHNSVVSFIVKHVSLWMWCTYMNICLTVKHAVCIRIRHSLSSWVNLWNHMVWSCYSLFVIRKIWILCGYCVDTVCPYLTPISILYHVFTATVTPGYRATGYGCSNAPPPPRPYQEMFKTHNTPLLYQSNKPTVSDRHSVPNFGPWYWILPITCPSMDHCVAMVLKS